MNLRSLLLPLFIFATSLAPLTAPAADAASEEKDLLLKSIGRLTGASMMEAYLSLDEMEKSLAKEKAGAGARYALHLRIQHNMLKLQKETFEELAKQLAGTVEEKAMKMAGDLTAMIMEQNEAVTAAAQGDAKDLDTVRRRHVASRSVLLSFLQIPSDNETIP